MQKRKLWQHLTRLRHDSALFIAKLNTKQFCSCVDKNGFLFFLLNLCENLFRIKLYSPKRRFAAWNLCHRLLMIMWSHHSLGFSVRMFFSINLSAYHHCALWKCKKEAPLLWQVMTLLTKLMILPLDHQYPSSTSISRAPYCHHQQDENFNPKDAISDENVVTKSGDQMLSKWWPSCDQVVRKLWANC